MIAMAVFTLHSSGCLNYCCFLHVMCNSTHFFVGTVVAKQSMPEAISASDVATLLTFSFIWIVITCIYAQSLAVFVLFSFTVGCG